jgi:hypothetical protein
MSFQLDLPQKIRISLKYDNPKYHESGQYINGLVCPVCDKKEAFAHFESPMAIICHSNNKCGATTPIKQVYPDLWQDLAKRYPPTKTNSKATATAYLESRGLNPALLEFKQGFEAEHQTLVIEQDGVKFRRLIDYTGKDKNRLNPYKGKVYKTPLVDDSDTVFVVEGILNALSLEQSGIAAIATYSSGAIPEAYYSTNRDKAYVLSFDNDVAGIKGIEKTIECFKKLEITGYKIALPPKGSDWNDLLVGDRLNDEAIDKAHWQGELAFAATPTDYFEIYRKRYPDKNSLIFEHGGWTWKAYLKKVGDDMAIIVKPFADCTLRLLHSVIDDSQDDRQRMEHYLELNSSREGKGRLRLDATEFSQLNSFKTALLNHRQLFFGNGDDLTSLAGYLFNQKAPKIRALSTIGFDAKSSGFYYPKFMYDKDGRRVDANGDKYFTSAGIKPFMDCSDAIISRVDAIDIKRFISLLHSAYGYKGLLALGFYVSAAFSHLVFDEYSFYPFLSLYGDPHAGKSFISRLLNRCFFVDSEGQTMTASNTAKGELRKISQKSSMVCALLEGRKDKSRFDYDSILPLYNRNSLYSRATTSQDNRTHELPLKAAISFVWNHECFTLKPAKERVISLHFADKDLTEETGAAWTELNAYSPDQLAGVGHFILTNRKQFEADLIPEIKDLSATLKNEGVTVTRIAENHAIALAGIVTLLNALGMNEISFIDLIKYAIERAKNKLDTAKTESHLADYFFESIADFNTTKGVCIADGVLVVHLPTVLSELQAADNGFNNKGELIAELKRHDRFIEIKTSRKTTDKDQKCYHFKAE